MSSATPAIEADEKQILMPQFDDLGQQAYASSLGMWLFLASEVMFFSGLLAAYTIYRARWPHEFAAASRLLNWPLGFINTAVLLVSSLAMALAVRAAQLGRRRETVRWMVLTMILGTAFLGIKASEYYVDYREHLIPGLNFEMPHEIHGAEVPADLDPGHFQMFFVLYFFITGLHAFHMIVGITIVGIIAYLVHTRWFSGHGESQVEVIGLYWHFVDVVWVFLYPLLYLIDIHS
ncbi:cytochrome c oxidase subunit 3 [Aquisphaera insulae]|uniref:cytochrome c oxidase subunit 3 n=1 Tax=Aquisphaera insulae TaxID=2712864 RepID=UPI00202EDA59|nr:cytochrome c oxidase subunit 3 [Aquisphaera insulae]